MKTRRKSLGNENSWICREEGWWRFFTVLDTRGSGQNGGLDGKKVAFSPTSTKQKWGG